MIRAKEAFRFYTRLHLSQLTGLRASNLEQLVKNIKEVPDSCIYHHTHRFLQQHQYLSPEPPNDFAYWVSEILADKELGERLASIDTVQFTTIQGLRNKFVDTIEDYIKDNPSALSKFTSKEEFFPFIKSISFILPTDYIVYDLKEFTDVLQKITIDSIYFHIFEARLRLNRKTNDFSYWIETSIGDRRLALEISRLDPYTCTLEELRNKIVKIIKKHVKF